MSQSNTKAPTKKRARKSTKNAAKNSVVIAKAEKDFSTVPQPANEAMAFMQLLEKAAKDPEVDVGKMESLLRMKKEILHEQRVAAFNKDYLAAKLEMPRVTKDGEVMYPVDKNKPDGPKQSAFKWAKYETIDKAIRPIEVKYGFSRSFTTVTRDATGGGVTVTCRLLHKDGHYQEASIPVALDTSGGKNNVQAAGSSFAYGKRYTTEMIWDIVKEGEDDDGNAAFVEAPIDEAQLKAFQEIIDTWQIDTAKFCGHLKVESLAAIPNKMYPKAMNDLKAYVEKIKAVKASKEGTKHDNANQ